MSNTLPIENYVPLTMKQKLYALDAFFIEKLKLSENDPCTKFLLIRTAIFFSKSLLCISASMYHLNDSDISFLTRNVVHCLCKTLKRNGKI